MRETPSVPLEEIKPDCLELDGRFTPKRKEQRDIITNRLFRYWRGDLHAHSAESTRPDFGYAEGVYTIEEMMKYYEELGLEFAAFTNHGTKPGEPHQADITDPVSQSFLRQTEIIEKMNKESKIKMAALSSAEANILFDANGQPVLDLPDEVLKELDLVVASRHGIKNEKDINQIKDSLLMAANHPQVDIIGHPDRYIRLEGGITDQGKPCDPEKYWQVWDEVLEAMAQNGKAFEINLNDKSRPADELLRRAAARGLRFVLNFDAHDFDQYGKETGQAKQKWAKGSEEPSDIEDLAEYKSQRLAQGPGVRAIRLLMIYLKKLETLGVDESRVINSSRERLLQFLTGERGRKTENLDYLKDKFSHAQTNI